MQIALRRSCKKAQTVYELHTQKILVLVRENIKLKIAKKFIS